MKFNANTQTHSLTVRLYGFCCRYITYRAYALGCVFACESPTCFSSDGFPQRAWENPWLKRFLQRASACYLPPALPPHRLDGPCAWQHRIPAFNLALLSGPAKKQAQLGSVLDRPSVNL